VKEVPPPVTITRDEWETNKLGVNALRIKYRLMADVLGLSESRYARKRKMKIPTMSITIAYCRTERGTLVAWGRSDTGAECEMFAEDLEGRTGPVKVE